MKIGGHNSVTGNSQPGKSSGIVKISPFSKKEYILIDQYHYHVMQYLKTAESQWSFTELKHESATLSLFCHFPGILNKRRKKENPER